MESNLSGLTSTTSSLPYASPQKIADNPPKRLYEVQEVIAITSLGRTSIYKAIGEGLLIAKKFGKKTLITAESLEAFIASLPLLSAAEGK